MNSLKIALGALPLVASLVATTANAHVGLTSPVTAGGTAVLSFGVGHGCEGADTVAIEVQMPESVTSVRAMPSAWGEAEVIVDDAQLVTAVRWTKTEARAADDHYYTFGLRVGVPDAPFTVLYFKTIQTCRDAEDTEYSSEWTATLDEVGDSHDGELLPSPVTVILPERGAGWNQWEAPVEITDMQMFDDAQIVWVGDAAYSANPTTAAMIEDDADVTLLESIPAGSTIWVKY